MARATDAPALPGRTERAARAVSALMLVVLALGACGRKGPPVAPGVRVPRPITNFSGLVEEDGSIHFGWTNPTRRTDNVRLYDLATARVFRAEDDGTGEPRPAILSRGRVPGYTELMTIRFPLRARSGEPPGPAPPPPAGVVVDGDHVRVTDTRGVVPGRRYTYVVTVEDAVGRESPPSSRLSISTIAAAEPPTGLTAQAGDGEVRLAWQPPTRAVGGESLAGTITYEVLRAADPDGPLAPISPVPAADTTFTDRGAANDHTYAYAVRAVRVDHATTVRGRASERVAATPRDVTPPSAPRNLVGIPATGVVRLRWEPNPEPDVARYVVYRAGPGGVFSRVGSVAPPATAFIDQGVAPGTYRYVVTAEDLAATPNESARSDAITVVVP